MITVGVKHEHEMAKRLISSGVTDVEFIVCRSGVDWKTATDFVNQWNLWKQNEEVSPLRIRN